MHFHLKGFEFIAELHWLMLHMHSEVGNLQDGLRHVETKFEKHETESMKKGFSPAFLIFNLYWAGLKNNWCNGTLSYYAFAGRAFRENVLMCFLAVGVENLAQTMEQSVQLISSPPILRNPKTWEYSLQNKTLLNMQSMSRFLDCKARDMFSCPLDTSKASMFLAIPCKQDWGTIANPHKVQQADIKLTEIARRILWDLVNLKQDTYALAGNWNVSAYLPHFASLQFNSSPISIVSLHLPSCNMQTAPHDTSAASPDSTVQPVWTFLQHLGNVRNMEVFTVRELKQLTKATPNSNKDSKDSHCKTIYLWQSSVYKQPHTLIRLF